MKRPTIALAYTEEYLEVDRPQPLSDNRIESLIQDVLSGKLDKDISDNVYENFKTEMISWLSNSQLNSLLGLDQFTRIDIINGCTQFIDNLYMISPVQVLNGDYRYHERLGLAYIRDVGSLIPGIPLIMAMPFPSVGSIHNDIDEIFYECKLKQIDVHIDGAWITCCKDIKFNFNNDIIKSFGISLSKGLGLGWNRIGLRWSKGSRPDSISIMNDFRMNNRALSMIGLHFLKNLPSDYLWNTHSEKYFKVCKDFNLSPTNSIYLALKNGRAVGVSPLIRYLENE
jgi:hypothetical protein